MFEVARGARNISQPRSQEEASRFLEVREEESPLEGDTSIHVVQTYKFNITEKQLTNTTENKIRKASSVIRLCQRKKS